MSGETWDKLSEEKQIFLRIIFHNIIDKLNFTELAIMTELLKRVPDDEGVVSMLKDQSGDGGALQSILGDKAFAMLIKI